MESILPFGYIYYVIENDNPPVDNQSIIDNSNFSNTTNISSSSLGEKNNQPGKKLKLAAIVFALLLVVSAALFYSLNKIKTSEPKKTPADNSSVSQSLEKFKNEAEFKKYIEESKRLASDDYFGGGSMMALDLSSTGEFGPMAGIGSPSLRSTTPYRVSDTNVQVKGIDEPDILKSDGKNIYYSSQGYYLPQPLPFMEGDITTRPAPDYRNPETKIIEAFPPENLKESSQLKDSGNMLLSGNNLIIFSQNGDKLVAYSTEISSAPREEWRMELKDKNRIVTGRLMGKFVYLITATQVTPYDGCNFPIFGGTREISIVCTDIYRPGIATPADSTFTVFKIDPASGEVKEKSSFLGSSGQSVTYMSPNAVYITYTKTEGIINVLIDFVTEEIPEFFPAELVEKMEKVRAYDLSTQAKYFEIERLMEEYQNSLTNDEKVRLENEIENKMESYFNRRSRDLTQTAVAKIDINSFNVSTSQLVPGTPLNQFSLDEYEGNLRIATTIGGGIFGSEQSANDVYVLDSGLNIIGSVKDLGLTERIYAVRFIADKGYVVTFRQIDPFYVLDLSDPNNPELKGELKIPGYSGYLHPIDKNNIIGVGKEGNNVKLSLFNVENPSQPIESSKYDLDEFYSEAVNNHHAFLLDAQNEIFFMPGGKGGYIFSYSGSTFSLKRVVSDIVAKRAVYINNYLYIAGDDKIVVLNMADFEEVNRLTF